MCVETKRGASHHKKAKKIKFFASIEMVVKQTNLGQINACYRKLD